MYLPRIQAYPQSGGLVGGSTHVPSLPFRLACTFEQTVRRPHVHGGASLLRSLDVGHGATPTQGKNGRRLDTHRFARCRLGGHCACRWTGHQGCLGLLRTSLHQTRALIGRACDVDGTDSARPSFDARPGRASWGVDWRDALRPDTSTTARRAAEGKGGAAWRRDRTRAQPRAAPGFGREHGEHGEDPPLARSEHRGTPAGRGGESYPQRKVQVH